MTDATMNPATAPKGGQGSNAKLTYGALAVAVVAAAAGWTQYFNTRTALDGATADLTTATSDLTAARGEIDAMKAQFGAVGLDASTPAALGVSLAAQKRVLTDVENALVSKAAAVAARDAQLAKAAATLDTVQSAAAAATAAESEASALFADLDARNRDLTGRVAELESASVSWGAAAGARRAELDKLIADVEANQALIADAAMWREKGAVLTAEQARLASAVTDLENKVVSLTAAVNFRQTEVAKAVVALSSAQADERDALMTALDLRAESAALSKSIVTLGAERERVNAALTDVNNRFIPALAAVEVREKQLAGLIADVTRQQEAQAALTAANADLQTRLTIADDRLAEITTVATEAAKHLQAIDDLLGTPTVQAALKSE